MSSWNERTRALPIAFRPLDVEGRCKPVPVVPCPRRGGEALLAVCSQCRHAHKVAFEAENVPVLLCDSGRNDNAASACAPTTSVRDVMRLPALCIAGSSSIGVLLPHLAPSLTGFVPVLDLAARPIGVLSVARLRETIRAGIDLEATADALPSEPWQALDADAVLADAAARFAAGAPDPLLVLGSAGALLGLLWASDLEP